MNQEIHSHLEKLKSELNKLEPAVKHLQQADTNATALINSLSNVHQEFSKHLKSIEKSLAEANEKHQKQLSKEIQETSTKLKDVGNTISSSFYKVDQNIKELLDEYELLSTEAGKLVEKIDKVDFTNRLDKLDVTISSINLGLQKSDLNQNKLDSGVQSTQQKVSELGGNFKADIDVLRSFILAKIDLLNESFSKDIATIQKQLNFQKILFFSIVALNVITLIILLIKK